MQTKSADPSRALKEFATKTQRHEAALRQGHLMSKSSLCSLESSRLGGESSFFSIALFLRLSRRLVRISVTMVSEAGRR